MNPYLPADHQNIDDIETEYTHIELGEPAEQLCPLCGGNTVHAEALDGYDEPVAIVECQVCGYQDLPQE